MNFCASFLILAIFVQCYQFTELDTDEWNIFSYPGKAESERDLQVCKERQVCSVVHKRLWFPRQVERLCRCEINECPSTWSDESDNFTLGVSNRAQMKFCEPVNDLPICSNNETTFLHMRNQTNGQDLEFSAVTECFCPPHHMWVENKRFGNASGVYHVYRCSKLPKCNEDELCGLERTDNYEVYYHCSCPVGSLCIRRNNTEWPIEKMFYSGKAYKAVCTKYPPFALGLARNAN